eukprot:TRINITY_DN13089_c0_g1_i1.p1 TRINITY_DN13089_c0_g1~~TRINITY_DN13089_c0_g1_i1.p1  ORF type:complete len:228 (+),score=20.43 TRINITY_DN13089_c0_g1_i1:661-1344(+)
MTIYPTFIQPLFDTVEELEPGSLRGKIEALATRTGFPLTKLFKIDGSKRSGHSNAYFYGFHKNKRIVLYDTLIEQATEDEVVAVLGHELGHYFLNHTIQNLIIAQLYFFSLLYLFGKVLYNPDLYHSFGFATPCIMVGLHLFMLLLTPVDNLMSFLLNMRSRHNEFQADAYSVDLGYADGLSAGLIKLQTKNLSTMIPDPWYSVYHFSHPPLIERLNAIEEKNKRRT